MDRIHLLIVLAALLACSEEKIGLTEPSGERAFSYLEEQCAMGPRFPGSPGHDRLVDYLYAFLKESADSVRRDAFTVTDSAGKELHLTNIVAAFKPGHAPRVLFCCHFDTRPVCDEAKLESERSLPVPGANDGASGTAVLMEIAHALHEVPPACGVDLVFFDGEDNPGEMLLGSKEFARRSPDYRPLFGILVDMVGDRDLAIKKEMYSNMAAPEVVARVWRKAASLGYASFFPDLVGYAVLDDHIPLLRSGIRCIDVIDFDYPHWHTPRDTPDKCSAKSLEIVARVLLSLIYDIRDTLPPPPQRR